ncbi:DDE-type integrase/transposase/recombinase, partial [Parapedobacter deserti]
MSLDQKRALVCPGFEGMSVSKQCKSLGLERSSYYFKPRGESLFNQQLMGVIDRQFLEHPYLGAGRMTDWLKLDMGYHVNIKRVRRLYKVMNLRTLFPKRNLSKAKAGDYKYPYLLNGLEIDRPNQVWQADITYIPMFRGFMYLFAIIDVYSRRIMGWSTSNTMSVEWCRDVLKDTLRDHGTPEIFN